MISRELWRRLSRVSIVTAITALSSLVLSTTPALAATTLGGQFTSAYCYASDGASCDTGTSEGSGTAFATSASGTTSNGQTHTSALSFSVSTSGWVIYAIQQVVCTTSNGVLYEAGDSWRTTNSTSVFTANYSAGGTNTGGGLNVTSWSAGSTYWSCPSAGEVIAGVKVFWRLNSSPFTEVDGFYVFSAASTACTTTSFTSVSGSYSGTTLAVRFGYAPSSKPSGGWNVIAPDPGNNNGTPTGVVGLNATVDGAANTYYASFTLSTAPSTMTARIWANDASDAYQNCYVSLTLSSNAISSTPPVTGQTGGNDTGTDNTQATNCGLSLNPAHWIKCLFWPETSFQQWNSLQSTAKTHVPTSLVIGGIGYVSTTEQVFQNNSTTGNACDNGDYAASCDNVPAFDGPAVCNASEAQTGITNPDCYSARLNLITSAGDVIQNHAWGNILYGMMSIGVAVTGFMLCWRLVSASIGGKEAE